MKAKILSKICIVGAVGLLFNGGMDLYRWLAGGWWIPSYTMTITCTGLAMLLVVIALLLKGGNNEPMQKN